MGGRCPGVVVGGGGGGSWLGVVGWMGGRCPGGGSWLGVDVQGGI